MPTMQSETGVVWPEPSIESDVDSTDALFILREDVQRLRMHGLAWFNECIANQSVANAGTMTRNEIAHFVWMKVALIGFMIRGRVYRLHELMPASMVLYGAFVSDDLGDLNIRLSLRAFSRSSSIALTESAQIGPGEWKSRIRTSILTNHPFFPKTIRHIATNSSQLGSHQYTHEMVIATIVLVEEKERRGPQGEYVFPPHVYPNANTGIAHHAPGGLMFGRLVAGSPTVETRDKIAASEPAYTADFKPVRYNGRGELFFVSDAAYEVYFAPDLDKKTRDAIGLGLPIYVSAAEEPICYDPVSQTHGAHRGSARSVRKVSLSKSPETPIALGVVECMLPEDAYSTAIAIKVRPE